MSPLGLRCDECFKKFFWGLTEVYLPGHEDDPSLRGLLCETCLIEGKKVGLVEATPS
jgi:hypothetical protein